MLTLIHLNTIKVSIIGRFVKATPFTKMIMSHMQLQHILAQKITCGNGMNTVKKTNRLAWLADQLDALCN